MIKKLIFTDGVNQNSNKFYEMEVSEDIVIVRFGRVGSSAQSKTYTGGQKKADSILREKLAKGYTEVKLLDSSISNQKIDLNTIACSQITGTSTRLVGRLVTYNVHNILSNTNITLNSNGLFQTPLGVVTLDTITDAKVLLDSIVSEATKSKDISILNSLTSQYLRKIPKSIGTSRPIFENIFYSAERISKEYEILEDLKTSVSALQSQSNITDVPKIWDTDLSLLVDKTERERVITLFNDSKKSMHRMDSYIVKEIYTVNIKSNIELYSKCNFNNEKELWHGTGASNILSILKSGLKVSPPSTAHIAGKAFGNGIYTASSCTKSLGYSTGRWGGSSKECFLFLSSVKLGNPYYPNRSGDCSYYMKEHNSVIALPKNISTLMNEEYIIFNNNQIVLKYLLEINN